MIKTPEEVRCGGNSNPGFFNRFEEQPLGAGTAGVVIGLVLVVEDVTLKLMLVVVPVVDDKLVDELVEVSRLVVVVPSVEVKPDDELLGVPLLVVVVPVCAVPNSALMASRLTFEPVTALKMVH